MPVGYTNDSARLGKDTWTHRCPRLSAIGLFGMTMVIQLFVVPGGWSEHILWLSLSILIIARGPGAIALDHLICSVRIPVPVLAGA